MKELTVKVTFPNRAMQRQIQNLKKNGGGPIKIRWFHTMGHDYFDKSVANVFCRFPRQF